MSSRFVSDTITVLSENPLGEHLVDHEVAGIRPGYITFRWSQHLSGLHRGEEIEFFTHSEFYSAQLLLLVRILLTVLLGSTVLIFVFEATRLLFRRIATSLVADIAFMVPPFV